MNNRNKSLTFISIVLFFLFIGLVYQLTTGKLKQINSYAPKISITPTIIFSKYYSSFLKLSFIYPQHFEVKDGYNSIYLIGPDGRFNIGSIGTNYENLEGHLDDLERLNKINVVSRKKMKINDIDAIKATIASSNTSPDTYIYFFYPEEWTVYSISTDSKELEKDLDKIAQSFTFKP